MKRFSVGCRRAIANGAADALVRKPDRTTAKRNNRPPERSRLLPALGAEAFLCPLARNGAAVGSVRSCCRASGGARARRRPRLLFTFVGVFPLRYAAEQLSAELFQLPPRMTRCEPWDR